MILFEVIAGVIQLIFLLVFMVFEFIGALCEVIFTLIGSLIGAIIDIPNNIKRLKPKTRGVVIGASVFVVLIAGAMLTRYLQG